MNQLREVYSELRLRKDFDKLSDKRIEDSCGWLFPIEVPAKMEWVVNAMFKDEQIIVPTQQEADCIAREEQILSLLLQARKKAWR
jgi:hypothetical protein